ncbi:PQQ-dependent sugar dehydrogenase [Winogradskyella sp.]|uniref:PQQ-dependent sugar dehydrogenase n=1 Tax=Winogradskyella sp. TaxID=1883156 RepID=UPI0025D2AE83|nr:PQQ-dependent sugar dehydrogenase [Winogradskyella sp.]
MKLTTTFILFLLCLTSSFAQDLGLELFVSGLNRPVNIKHAGDDRLFVVEQDGFIKIINANGTIESTLFLDIDSRVRSSGNEQGLLGLAFHPDYITNGYFFVNYINNSGNTVVSRFSRNGSNPSIADPNSEFPILNFNQPFSNHNGGDLAFGPDGYLYISTGDGGSGGDPQGNSQNTSNLLGNLLRIDIDTTTPPLNYSIPSNNPFVGSSTARDEIWAYGLRNPWKFSFDRLNGDIWIGDVGQGEFEEINRASGSSGGLNYGWRCYEGNNFTTYNNTNCPSMSTMTFPVSEYSHFDGEFKCSVTGGYRYRGSAYPNFEGWYFFADYCSGEIGNLVYNSTTDAWSFTFEVFSGNWAAFGEDINGELYVSSLGGSIYKLIDNDQLGIDENNLNSISIYPNPTENELNINFNNNLDLSTEILIYDIQGKIVKTMSRNTETIQKINTSELSSGIYILKINTDNGEQSTHKLVIN